MISVFFHFPLISTFTLCHGVSSTSSVLIYSSYGISLDGAIDHYIGFRHFSFLLHV
jgi:hypothetical protein